MANATRAREDRSLTLAEAAKIYEPRSADSKPLDNRRIRTQLKKELRRRVELALERDWSEISQHYRAHYFFWGDPRTGTATILVTDSTVCYGFGALQRPVIRMSFLQKELFKKN